MKQKSRKQCNKKGCRKLRAEGWEQCDEHRPYDPVEDAVRLTVAEAEKWGRLDAEIRNDLLTQRCMALESQLASIECKEKLHALANHYQEQLNLLATQYKQHKEQAEQGLSETKRTRSLEHVALKQQVTSKQTEYRELTKTLADKYQVDLTKMSIDPDTQIIRETD